MDDYSTPPHTNTPIQPDRAGESKMMTTVWNEDTGKCEQVDLEWALDRECRRIRAKLERDRSDMRWSRNFNSPYKGHPRQDDWQCWLQKAHNAVQDRDWRAMELAYKMLEDFV